MGILDDIIADDPAPTPAKKATPFLDSVIAGDSTPAVSPTLAAVSAPAQNPPIAHDVGGGSDVPTFGDAASYLTGLAGDDQHDDSWGTWAGRNAMRFAGGLPKFTANAANTLVGAGIHKAHEMMPGSDYLDTLDKINAARTARENQQFKDAGGDSLASTAGEAVGSIPLALSLGRVFPQLTMAPIASKIGFGLLDGAAQGGAFSYLNSAGNQDAGAGLQTGIGAGVGAATSLLGPLGGAVSGQFARMAPRTADIFNRFRQATGVTPDWSQAVDADPFARKTRQMLSYIPFSGVSDTPMQDAAAKFAGNLVEPGAGREISRDMIDRNLGIPGAQGRLGQEYDAWAARAKADPSHFNPRIDRIETDLNSKLSTRDAGTIQEQIDNIRNTPLDRNGMMHGTSWQQIDEQLKDLSKAGGTNGAFARQLRSTMDGAFSPRDQAARAAIDARYAPASTLDKVVTPTDYLALRQLKGKVHKGSDPGLQMLRDIGQATAEPRDSGTPIGNLVTHILAPVGTIAAGDKLANDNSDGFLHGAGVALKDAGLTLGGGMLAGRVLGKGIIANKSLTNEMINRQVAGANLPTSRGFQAWRYLNNNAANMAPFTAGAANSLIDPMVGRRDGAFADGGDVGGLDPMQEALTENQLESQGEQAAQAAVPGSVQLPDALQMALPKFSAPWHPGAPPAITGPVAPAVQQVVQQQPAATGATGDPVALVPPPAPPSAATGSVGSSNSGGGMMRVPAGTPGAMWDGQNWVVIVGPNGQMAPVTGTTPVAPPTDAATGASGASGDGATGASAASGTGAAFSWEAYCHSPNPDGSPRTMGWIENCMATPHADGGPIGWLPGQGHPFDSLHDGGSPRYLMRAAAFADGGDVGPSYADSDIIDRRGDAPLPAAPESYVSPLYNPAEDPPEMRSVGYNTTWDKLRNFMADVGDGYARARTPDMSANPLSMALGYGDIIPGVMRDRAAMADGTWTPPGAATALPSIVTDASQPGYDPRKLTVTMQDGGQVLDQAHDMAHKAHKTITGGTFPNQKPMAKQAVQAAFALGKRKQA